MMKSKEMGVLVLPPPKDLVGQRFGRLVVMRRADDHISRSGRHDVVYLCRCDCGSDCKVMKSALTRGYTKSCGCLRRELVSKRLTKRDDTSRKLRIVYVGMIGRCYDEKNKRYNRYGKRGIGVCDEWRGESGLERFVAWAKENGYSKGLAIDRIDNDGWYCPDNCRWVDNKTQSNNRSSNRRLVVCGEEKTVSEWSEYCNISRHALYKMSDDDAVKRIEKALLNN